MINKTIAVTIGFMLFFAAGTAFIVMSDSEEDRSPTVSVLAMVNAEGSGIFSSDKNLKIDDPAGWGGKSFMTPGAGSIQHEMLRSLASDFNMSFVSGTGSDPNTIYWSAVAPANMTLAEFWGSGNFDGGIVWEPWYTQIITKYRDGHSEGDAPVAYKIATTDKLEKGHPCCMVVADNNFMKNNEELTIRFLLAYVHATEWVNRTIGDRTLSTPPATPEYLELERVAWTTAFGGDGTPSAAEKLMIWNAVRGITYAYEIESGIVGGGLKPYTAALITKFHNSGNIVEKVNDPVMFADKLINYDMLSDTKSKWDGTEMEGIFYDPSQLSFGTVRLGALQNDLHQIAIRVAMDKNLFHSLNPGFPANTSLFDAYGVNISLAALQPNGPGVMNLFATNSIDIGVLGLPPVVIRTANGL